MSPERRAKSASSLHLPTARHGARFAVALAGVLMLAVSTATANSDAERRMASLARQALDNDTQLGALNLGVSVRDQVASVWGTVPSPAVAERAVTCLGRVPGVARVENQLTVESPGDPLVDFLKMPARPLPPKPAPGMRALDPTPTVPKSTRTALGPVPVWQPAPVFRAPASPAPVREPKLASRTDVVAAAPTMPLIPLPVTRPIAVPLHDEAKPDSDRLTTSIADVLKGSDRLRGIKPEVRGGIVYLRGQVHDWEELHAFARQISRLPGVERVVMDGVRTAPR
jgi:osmotically-inducible protein OsmY